MSESAHVELINRVRAPRRARAFGLGQPAPSEVTVLLAVRRARWRMSAWIFSSFAWYACSTCANAASTRAIAAAPPARPISRSPRAPPPASPGSRELRDRPRRPAARRRRRPRRRPPRRRASGLPAAAARGGIARRRRRREARVERPFLVATSVTSHEARGQRAFVPVEVVHLQPTAGRRALRVAWEHGRGVQRAAGGLPASRLDATKPAAARRGPSAPRWRGDARRHRRARAHRFCSAIRIVGDAASASTTDAGPPASTAHEPSSSSSASSA